eukprot:9358946-Pyramimonas_sp.AAC.2
MFGSSKSTRARWLLLGPFVEGGCRDAGVASPFDSAGNRMCNTAGEWSELRAAISEASALMHMGNVRLSASM